jgi:hypothetical protein
MDNVIYTKQAIEGAKRIRDMPNESWTMKIQILEPYRQPKDKSVNKTNNPSKNNKIATAQAKVQINTNAQPWMQQRPTR